MNIKENSEYFNYLFRLQKSGVTNMFGAAHYLKKEFIELERRQLEKILVYWMEHYETIAKELGVKV